MDTFVLHVRRQVGLVASATSTKVIIDGSARASLRVGGVQHFTLPRKPVNVMLLIQVPFGKDIEKLITIDPRDSSEVTLSFTNKFNPKTLFFLNAFTQPSSFIETEILYGPSVSNQAVSSLLNIGASSEPNPAVGNYKFCTSCGTKLNSSSKFCSNCGAKLE